ncbi:pheromone-regulated protein prm10 [Cryptotrichosporon argae]
MSVPDNPFDKRDGARSPPRLEIHYTDDPTPADVTDAPLASPTVASPSRRASRTGTSPSPSQPPSGSLLMPGQQGAKTPRRVQWTSDSHIVSMMPAPERAPSPEPSSPSQMLDASNLARLDDMLEIHRAASHRRAHGAHARSNLSIASSANEGSGVDPDDYDYRLDVDPPVDGAVAVINPLEQVLSPGTIQSVQDSRPPEAILDNGVNDVAASYIPLGETDGLPTMPQHEASADAAKDLVRAHTGKWGVLRRRVKTASAVRGAFGAHHTDGHAPSGTLTESPTRLDPNDEKAMGRRPSVAAAAVGANPPINAGLNGMPAIPGGTSVLSSLLALYGQQQAGINSGTTTPASSRPPSTVGSDEDEWSDNERRRRASGMAAGRHAPWAQRGRDDSASPSRGPEREPEPEDGFVPIIDEATGRRESSADREADRAAGRMFGTHHRSRSMTSIADREPASPGLLGTFQRAVDRFRDDRPKAARSGAGVFGALIQGTGNITGAATPAGSTLVPAAKRAGYTLSRYTLPEADSVAAAEAKVWRPPTRPGSRAGSRAGSRPASIHSSTAVDDSPTSRDDASLSKTMTRTKSSDDVVSLATTAAAAPGGPAKKKKATLGPLNLKTLERLPGQAFREGGQALKSAERWIVSGGRTPEEKSGIDYFGRPLSEDERRRREWEAEKRRRKRAKEAKKKQEIFIIQHVAAILARQQFLLKLARALMMFGSPSHRLETQIQATAKVLELNCQVVYLPGTMLISFGDDATHTSETKFLKQSTGLDLGKLLVAHNLYWDVVHDKISVDDASKELDRLMTTPVYYNAWQTCMIGSMCSAFIVVPSFYGSFVDALMCIPLGFLLVFTQMIAAKNDMLGNVFEIAIACIISFLAAVLASTHIFCYTALVSGGVVLILPGYIVLCGALELASRNIVAGAVRIGYSVIYSLFLGFGISIGAEIYTKIIGTDVLNAEDYTCSSTHNDHWWMSTPSGYWYYLCVPAYAFFLSLRNQQPLFAKELPIMLAIACAGWVTNHFSSLAFPGRSDIVSAIGSFCVGILGNLYGRFSNGASFPVMVTGILFQLPSGLSNGGIFSFAADTGGTTSQYSEGFGVAEQLVSVAIGLTVGLFVSAVVTHPLGGGRKRGSGIFSF